MGKSEQVPNFWRIAWGDELPCDGGVYMRRWFLETPFFSVRLHHWLSSDDSRHLHDHPWWFWALVVRGSYVDVSVLGDDPLGVGSVRFRPACHRHWVRVASGGCWTILLTGGRKRRWGFWIRDRFVKANKYFLSHGKHPCR